MKSRWLAAAVAMAGLGALGAGPQLSVTEIYRGVQPVSTSSAGIAHVGGVVEAPARVNKSADTGATAKHAGGGGGATGTGPCGHSYSSKCQPSPDPCRDDPVSSNLAAGGDTLTCPFDDDVADPVCAQWPAQVPPNGVCATGGSAAPGASESATLLQEQAPIR